MVLPFPCRDPAAAAAYAERAPRDAGRRVARRIARPTARTRCRRFRCSTFQLAPAWCCRRPTVRRSAGSPSSMAARSSRAASGTPRPSRAARPPRLRQRPRRRPGDRVPSASSPPASAGRTARFGQRSRTWSAPAPSSGSVASGPLARGRTGRRRVPPRRTRPAALSANLRERPRAYRIGFADDVRLAAELDVGATRASLHVRRVSGLRLDRLKRLAQALDVRVGPLQAAAHRVDRQVRRAQRAATPRRRCASRRGCPCRR